MASRAGVGYSELQQSREAGGPSSGVGRDMDDGLPYSKSGGGTWASREAR
jgi:hypothetical protein